MATDLVMVPRGHYAATAGRRSDRRLSLLLAIGLLAGTVTMAAPMTAPRIDVSEEGGLYRVIAAFAVPETALTVMTVLTDYERIPKFMPDLQVSRVLERSAAGAVVEQEAVSRFMMFSKRVHLLLDIREQPGTLKFRDRCGKSFVLYEGEWSVTESDSLTIVDYRLTARPSFEVPGFVLKRLLKRDAAQLIDRIKAEIAVRENRGE